MSKKKIMLLSDDLRMSSGVGTMSKAFVLGTLGTYDWVQIGGAIKHPENGKVVNGGHVWFPNYKTVRTILEKTKFKDIRFYHYYDKNGKPVTHSIDYSNGFVQRTPDNDERVQNPYRPMSIVVDCIK